MNAAPVSGALPRLGRPGESIWIASSGHSATSPDRRGTIVHVLASRDQVHYRVRWDNGRESIVPASVTRVAPAS